MISTRGSPTRVYAQVGAATTSPRALARRANAVSSDICPGRTSLAPDPERPIGLVLSGGGARGAFQVGVWKVLRDHPRGIGRLPDVISGTSAGALNGSLIAAGLSPEDILNFWIDLADHPPVVANVKFFAELRRMLRRLVVREPLRALGRRGRELRQLVRLVRKHPIHSPSGLIALLLEFILTARFDSISVVLDAIATSHLFDTEPFRERFARAIGGHRLPRTRVRLAINTVDVHTGGVVRIVNHRPEKHPRASARHYRYEPTLTLDMILASASIPLLFNPVRVGELDLWDGGLLVNSPMAPCVALGARRIVPVLVTVGDHHDRRPMHSFGDALERLVDAFLENAYRIDRKLLLERNEVAARLPDDNLSVVELFMPIRPRSSALFNAGSYLYFEAAALREMYEAGQRAATRWLERGLELDGRNKPD